MNRSDEIQELAKALAKANKEVTNPQKNATNPHFKSRYSTLDKVIEAYKEVYLNHGITVLENPVTEDGNVGVEVTLLHESGQYITHDPFLLPPGKNTAQGYGSSITYCRRYALSSVMNISSEDDDDGNVASSYEPQNDPLNNEMMAKVADATRHFNSKDELFKAIGTDSKKMNTIYKANKKKEKQNIIKKLEDVINDYANAG